MASEQFDEIDGLDDEPGHRSAWKPTKPMRFQCAQVERRHVRRLRVLAALQDKTIAEILNTVLDSGLTALEAMAKDWPGSGERKA